MKKRVIFTNEQLRHYLITDTCSDSSTSHDLMSEVQVLGQRRPSQQNKPVNVIPLSLHKTGHVTLSIHSLTGDRIATLIDGVLRSGEYQLPFGATGLQDGTYIYRLNANGTVLIRTILLKK